MGRRIPAVPRILRSDAVSSAHRRNRRRQSLDRLLALANPIPSELLVAVDWLVYVFLSLLAIIRVMLASSRWFRPHRKTNTTTIMLMIIRKSPMPSMGSKVALFVFSSAPDAPRASFDEIWIASSDLSWFKTHLLRY